jgi:hypothetical protein
MATVSPFCRQDSHDRRAVPNQDISSGTWCNMCPSCARLYQHRFLLLHEEMAVTKEESRLNILVCGMQIEAVRVILSGHAELLQLQCGCSDSCNVARA